MFVEKLLVPQLVWKYSAFCWNRRFIIMFSRPCQIHPVYTIPLYFFRIHFNIILPSAPGVWNGLFSQSFPIKTLLTPPLFPICAACPTHLSLHFITDQFKPWSLFLQLPVTLSLLGPCFLLSTVFLNTCSLNGRNQVLILYETRGKVMLLCIIMCHIWYRNK